MLAWDKVCLPKGMEGLRFRDIRHFSIALLGRQVFALRLGNEILPTNAKIVSIRQNVNRECPRCGAGTETLVLALKDCPTGHAILTCGGLDGRFINNNYECCIDWIKEYIRFLDKKAIADFITILWNS
ncbi:hypothetical protein J1N35_025920 [Gossypium stocksii]|uniref:Reverse transcriptase zinc-binding domain-containing protein n=1 Tax=Gossypium stocksii TaxID=47602 RepID=A0A9D3ZXM3_9ROSI|nr:hypothetical protein J1N35_025920 [Gossypium stocksii]